jgi:hypothetical protein
MSSAVPIAFLMSPIIAQIPLAISEVVPRISAQLRKLVLCFIIDSYFELRLQFSFQFSLYTVGKPHNLEIVCLLEL